ncbi:ladderlectin-like [Channa argus]|uniref:ladderlectin-like n=1 Tax=Channa argus TaxID=215402 RepID=UPI00351FA2B0
MVLAGVENVVNESVSCPEGWFQLDCRCFHYVSTPMSWGKAELNCLSMGANLASVHNMQENTEFQRQVVAATHEYDDTWIGGFNVQKEKVWLWSDGSHFDHKNWCPGEPNNAQGSQHCLLITFGDLTCWDDYQCGSFHPSLCAKKA